LSQETWREKRPAWTVLPNLCDKDTNNALHSESRDKPGISAKVSQLTTYFNVIFELCSRTALSRCWCTTIKKNWSPPEVQASCKLKRENIFQVAHTKEGSSVMKTQGNSSAQHGPWEGYDLLDIYHCPGLCQMFLSIISLKACNSPWGWWCCCHLESPKETGNTVKLQQMEESLFERDFCKDVELCTETSKGRAITRGW
jgi:hypothetical protein